MNVLITSAGKRGYLIRYFKAALKGKGRVFAADCSQYAPALYDADEYFLIPPVSDSEYIKELEARCVEHSISGIVSLSDLELPVLAENKDNFLALGVKVIVSAPKVIDICFDKYKTYQFLKESGFTYAKTFINLKQALEEIKKGALVFPVLVKPRKGSRSVGISKVNTIKELEEKYKQQKDVVIQEYIDGDEYNLDLFNNSDLKPVAAFVKKKIQVRDGETYEEYSVYDYEILQCAKELVKKLGCYGPIDIDLFKKGNEYIVIDINPRFGGDYALSHALGAAFPEMVVSLIDDNKISPCYTKYPDNVWMMKQYEIVTRQF